MPDDQAQSENSPDNLSKQLESIAWPDIFYGMLISPMETLKVIGKRSLYSPGLAALLGAMLIVVVAMAAESAVGADSSSLSALVSTAFVFVFTGLFLWLTLAVFVRLLAVLMSKDVSIRSCFIVTGWAYLPLLFKAPAACFSNVTIFGDILSLVFSFWFLTLEIFAFDSVLELGRLKTLGFVLFLPACLFFTYMLSGILASIFVLDCFLN